MLSVLQPYVLIKRLGCVMRGKKHSGADVVGAFGSIGIMSKPIIKQTTEQIRSAGKNFKNSIRSPIRTLALQSNIFCWLHT